jgi:hypothetical protein
VEPGERLLLWCDGGPAIARAVTFPPPQELEVGGGVYVLIDDGPVESWHYQFAPDWGQHPGGTS